MQVLPKGQWKLSRTWGMGSSRRFSGSTGGGGRMGGMRTPGRKVQPVPGPGGWENWVGGWNREECDEFSGQEGRSKTRGLRRLDQARRTLSMVQCCWNIPWRQLGN